MNNRKKNIEDLMQSMHALRQQLMICHQSNSQHKVTPSQGLVLRFVIKNDLTNVKTIAQSLNISSSAATQLIDGLVENGYLIRSHNLNDRRIIALSVSVKAKKMFINFQNQGLDRLIKIFDILSDKELSQYTALNKKIINNIKEINK